jgi:hypothetical protein
MKHVQVGEKVILNPLVKLHESKKYSSQSTLTLDSGNYFEGEGEVFEVLDGYPVIKVKREDNSITNYLVIDHVCYPDYTKLSHKKMVKQ